MVKFIKFTLKKDRANKAILFNVLEYNRRHKFAVDGRRTWHIDFIRKKVYHESMWPNCFLNTRQFTFCFSGTTEIRQIRHNNGYEDNALFRLEDPIIGIDYKFPILDDESIDFWYDRIIEAFKIISQRM